MLTLTPAAAQSQTTLTAADTAAIVGALLSEYRTPNGPVVLVTLACETPRRSALAREDIACESASALAAIQIYATRNGADLGSVTSPVPACSWNRGESDTRKGLRMEVFPPTIVDGEVRIGFRSRCAGARGFMEAAVIQVALIGGVWRRIRTVSSIIT